MNGKRKTGAGVGVMPGKVPAILAAIQRRTAKALDDDWSALADRGDRHVQRAFYDLGRCLKVLEAVVAGACYCHEQDISGECGRCIAVRELGR